MVSILKNCPFIINFSSYISAYGVVIKKMAEKTFSCLEKWPREYCRGDQLSQETLAYFLHASESIHWIGLTLHSLFQCCILPIEKLVIKLLNRGIAWREFPLQLCLTLIKSINFGNQKLDLICQNQDSFYFGESESSIGSKNWQVWSFNRFLIFREPS